MMELKIEYVPIESIHEYSGNAKKHTKKQVKQIADSIQEFGFNDPIAVDGSGIVIEGHGRLLAARSLGMDKVPVITLDGLTDEQRRAYTLIHNQLTLNTENDLKQLAIELESIKSIDMPAFSLDLPEINLQIGEIKARHEADKERTDFADYNFLNTGYGIFDGAGKYEIPIIKPVYELPEIREWIGFNYVLSDKEPEGKAVHFFLDDYQFERLWNKPKQYIDKLRRYACVCSPDFSPMPHMPFVTQIFNHYRKHWIGRFLQENGVTVIPTIRAASDEKSFEYCFDGEPENSIVMYSAQWTQNKANREISQKEYDEMIKRLNPSKIFVYQNSDKEWLDFRGWNIEKVKMFRQSHWRGEQKWQRLRKHKDDIGR